MSDDDELLTARMVAKELKVAESEARRIMERIGRTIGGLVRYSDLAGGSVRLRSWALAKWLETREVPCRPSKSAGGRGRRTGGRTSTQPTASGYDSARAAQIGAKLYASLESSPGRPSATRPTLQLVSDAEPTSP